MKTEHTPEPWYSKLSAGDHQGLVISETDGQSIAVTYQGEADAARIVSCVNACAGLNPEAVPLLLDALKAAKKLLELTYGDSSMLGSQYAEETANEIEAAIAAANGDENE